MNRYQFFCLLVLAISDFSIAGAAEATLSQSLHERGLQWLKEARVTAPPVPAVIQTPACTAPSVTAAHFVVFDGRAQLDTRVSFQISVEPRQFEFQERFTARQTAAVVREVHIADGIAETVA